MRKFTFIAVIFCSFICNLSAQEGPVFSGDQMAPKINNYTTFTPPPVPQITPELTSNTPQDFQSHPEFGINPYNTQCEDCIELVSKRTGTGRYFIKSGSGGKTFYVQESAGDLHYIKEGYLVTIDPRLRPHPNTPGVYHAPDQPLPVQINALDGSTSLLFPGFDLTFNTNTKVYHITSSGETQVFGNVSYQNSTAGDDGMYTSNAWNNIDREIAVDKGKIKTNYIFNSMPSLLVNTGWLAFEEEITLPSGFVLTRDLTGQTTPENYWQGDLVVRDLTTNSEVARWDQAVMYDNGSGRPTASFIAYDIVSNGNTYYLRTLVDVSWLADNSRVFPVTVDPLVSGTGTYSAGLIGFTAYAPGNGFCGNSSAWCQATLNVNFPGQATITNVVWGLTYQAVNPAWMSDGGFRIAGPCGEDPANPNNWWSCGPPFGNAPGNCSGAGINSPALVTCLAPQCPASVITFRLKNIDCFGWAGACATAFLRTTNNTWTMTVQGQTVAQPAAPTSSLGTTICAGAVTVLTATGQWGVPGYTYLWAPGGQTTQSITVAPVVNTTYTCTITDACGLTASNTVAITIVTNNLTPAPVVNRYMTPAGGNPCPVTVTFCTNVGNNYGGGNENWVWGFPGGTVLIGGATSGSTAGPNYGGALTDAFCVANSGTGERFAVQYTVAGSYWATLSITKAGSCTSVNIPIVICGALPIQLTVFEANYLNGYVQLHWITESEDKNDFFTVERSTDGINFETVAIVDGAGTSSVRREYFAADENPPSGLVYYRLKQTDEDGNQSFSALESVTIPELSLAGFDIAPNPASASCKVFFEIKELSSVPVTLSLYDQLGKKILERIVDAQKGWNEIELDLKEIPAGAYLLLLSDGKDINAKNRKVLVKE